MTDKVRNWMESMPKQFRSIKKEDPTFPSHMIKPSSMIVTIGPTGCGKTNSVVEFLHRKDGRFFEIIIYTGSSSDEPYYNYLAGAIDGLQLIDNVAELPNIDNYKTDESKDLEKLIVFDDSVKKYGDEKVLKQIAKWFMCAHQDDVGRILRKYASDTDVRTMRRMHNHCTQNNGEFLTIAVKDPVETKYRHNFIGMLDPDEF
eukprot:scaffold7211_cov247-Ochromonas_danica.AAC.17